jgi:hypothetical protein
MKTFQEFNESLADDMIAHLRSKGLPAKKPMSKAESDAALKARAEKSKRENPPRKPEPYKEKYPLGGRDERSGRSYSEEFVREDNSHYEEAEKHLSKANDAEAKGHMKSFHAHMADHHDAMSEWHDSKGRSASADKHAEKADYHHEKSLTVKEGNDYFSRRKREEDIISGKKPARKKAPAQTSDYQNRRNKMKEEVEQIDEIMDVASTYKKIAVQHLRDMSAKGATQKQKDYAKAMNKRALEASKMNNHTDALNHYRGVKEEIEQIDEISQATKDSYAAKAKSEVDQLKSHVKGEYGGIVKRMIARRKKGIKLAQKKTNS